MIKRPLRPIPPVSRQDGVVLFIALVVLVVMTMVGISIIRQGSMSQIIIGNLAFREGATTAADRGVELARSWLASQAGSALDVSNSAQGYVADGLASAFDPFSYTHWKVSDQDSQRNTIEYVIHRLCPKAQQVTTNDNLCIVNSSNTDSKEVHDYSNRGIPDLMPYYRVTVRVTGPRNTTSYVQALLY